MLHKTTAMTHASICSGIDGPALAASWLGWQNLFHADINEFTNKVLKFYYPDAKQYTDIRNADFSEWRGKVDVLTAGFPCQPFSVAGQRTGEDHDSYLWPETLRVVNEVRPRWFIGENVNGIVSMVFPGEEINVGGQTDIFGAQDTLFERTDRYILDRICCDLETIGYETVPVVIPACAVGAYHERMRCFFLAHDNGDERLAGVQLDEQLWEAFIAESGFDASDSASAGCRTGRGNGCEIRERLILSGEQTRGAMGCATDGHNSERITTDPTGKLQQREIHCGKQAGKRAINDIRADLAGCGCIPNWDNFPTQSPVCSGDDELSRRLSGITFSWWRTESITALGNAIAPLQILPILRHIEMIDNYFAR